MKANQKDMTTGSPLRHIITFAIPLFLGMLFQQFYNIADTMIVSRTIGEGALAAVGSTGPISSLIIGFCTGLASGFVVHVAQNYGAKNYGELRKYAGNGLVLCALFAGIATIIAVVFCRTLLEVMNTPADIIDMAYSYIIVIFIGIPVTVAYNMLSGMMRSLGDSRSPLYLLIISSFINIGLDLLFILVFGLGAMGAALATVLSQAVSVAGCVYLIKRKIEVLQITKSDLRLSGTHVKKLLGNGIPMGLLMSLYSVGTVLLQAAVNGLGSVSVAAISAAGRFDGVCGMVTASIGTAVTTFSAQNMGAGNINRIKKGVTQGSIIAIGYSLVAFLIIFAFGRIMALLFIEESSTELIELIYQYMVTCAAFYWAMAFIHVVRFAIQGLGYGTIVMIAGLLEMVARAAVGIIFVPIFGYAAACFASPAAWVLADLFIIPAFIIVMRHAKKHLNHTSTPDYRE